jgi:hypothetical protein
MSRFGWTVCGLIVLGVGGLLAYNVWRDRADQRPLNNDDSLLAKARRQPAVDVPPPEPRPKDWIEVGGVSRPPTDIKPVAKGKSEPGGADAGYSPPNPGFVPLVKLDANPHTKSVAEALNDKTGSLGHRLSTLIEPPPFDRESYEKDPETYLNTVEPGRIWQQAEPGLGVVPLERKSRYSNAVLQGESVNLEVKVEPKMPVTFYSPRLGQFDNQLATMTVRADDEGIARATFKASSGTREEIEVFASSPVHSGLARFLIDVEVPAVASSNPNK